MGQSSAFQRSVNLVYSAAIPTQIYEGGGGGGAISIFWPKKELALSQNHTKTA